MSEKGKDRYQGESAVARLLALNVTPQEKTLPFDFYDAEGRYERSYIMDIALEAIERTDLGLSMKDKELLAERIIAAIEEHRKKAPSGMSAFKN